MGLARRFLTVLTLTFVMSGLVGCFRSDKPLIGKAEAAFPFEELTVKTEGNEIAILRKAGDAYAYVDPEKAADKQSNEKSILLHQMTDGLYILQESGQNGRSIYLFARRDGNKIVVSSICRAIDETALTKLGIERDRDGGDLADCVAKDFKSLTELAQMPVLWANETKTLEIVSIK